MIEKTKEQETELLIQVDRELFLSLLFNLIHNAVKASKPGGKIRIEAGDDRIVITDEGCGIPARDLSHVTEAFYMADKSRSRNEGGSGLGLALCEKIASLHGVRIEIKSRHKADGFPEEECGTQVILHCNLQPGGEPQS